MCKLIGAGDIASGKNIRVERFPDIRSATEPAPRLRRAGRVSVIADTCIGGMAESAACEDKFKVSNVGLDDHHAVLVLRQRNDRHGPTASEGDLGAST